MIIVTRLFSGIFLRKKSMTHRRSTAESHPERASGPDDVLSPPAAHWTPDALDQLSDGYYEIGRDLRYRRVNDAGARLVHKSAAEMIGRHVFDFFPDIQQSEVHRAVQRVMNGAAAEHVEVFYEPLLLWGVNSIYPIAEGVAIVSRDVTAEKLLQQNLSFLAEASKVLSSSLDLKRTLGEVTALADAADRGLVRRRYAQRERRRGVARARACRSRKGALGHRVAATRSYRHER